MTFDPVWLASHFVSCTIIMTRSLYLVSQATGGDPAPCHTPRARAGAAPQHCHCPAKGYQVSGHTPSRLSDSARHEQCHSSCAMCEGVMVCPSCRPQRLHRLGETHRSRCHPERETALALSETTPTSCWHQLTHSLLIPVAGLPHPSHGSALSGDPARLWHSFTRTLALALRPQNINPFLTEEEREEEEEERQACRSVASFVKYFVPERSYVGATAD